MKLVQLNIFGGKFLDDALEFLRKEDPDIVTLQEVLVSRKLDVFNAVKDATGLSGVFAKASGFRSAGGIARFGNAVFSRYGISSSKSVFLDFPYRIMGTRRSVNYYDVEELLTEPRNFISAVLDTPSGRLRVASVHMAWSEKCTERWHRIEAARKMVRYLLGKTPTVIAGDFNTHPESVSFGIINKYFHNFGDGMKNTLNPKRHSIFLREPRGLVVDYVLGRGVSGKARAVDADVSDHLPLASEIKINGKS